MCLIIWDFREGMALARERIQSEATHKKRKLNLQERELLLKEYQSGALTFEEYHASAAALRADD